MLPIRDTFDFYVEQEASRSRFFRGLKLSDIVVSSGILLRTKRPSFIRKELSIENSHSVLYNLPLLVSGVS